MGQSAAQIIVQLTEAVEQAAKALVLEIARNLRAPPPEGTPVQTGHARRNWIPSAGEPHSGDVGNDDSAYQVGLAAVLAWHLGDGPLWVSNDVDYIRALNYGHSRQSPAGFVERAVDMALAKAQERGVAGVDVLRAAYQDSVGGDAAANLASAYSPFGHA